MDTQNTRVTRAQAAELVGVSERTVSRWSAAGLLGVQRPPSGSPRPATYDRAKVLDTARRMRRVENLELPEPDISG